MSLQVLISVMNIADWRHQLRLMNIKSNFVMINQVTDPDAELQNYVEGGVVVHSMRGRGLSRSRNKAISLADSDVCLIADGDVSYNTDYEAVILKAFQDNPNMDIIIFSLNRVDGTVMSVKPGKLGLLHTMKVNSKQIAFRRASIVTTGLNFDERFGAGTDLYMGEENIFLSDCVKRGLKIFSHPSNIASLRPHESTWSRERNSQFYYVKGRMFYRISNILAVALSLRFVFRKSGPRNKSVGFFTALISALKGVKDESGVPISK